jgi:Cu(I)/Ag(I) efflux system membrane fusion protein
MRNLHIVIAAALAFALGIGMTLFVTRRSAEISGAAASNAPADKKVMYWYDPMVPQQHFDAPGKSPFMDMQLVPKYAGGDAGADESSVRIDPRLSQNLGVRTAKTERGTLAHPVRATGTLAFDERAVTAVQSRVAGIVEKLWVRAPLSAVKRGDSLVTLVAPDWTAAQEEYLSLRRSKGEGLDTLRAAAQQRLFLLGMDEGQIRAVETAGHAQTRITISAPRDGVITDLAVREGATVMAGAPLLTLTGLDHVWMNAAVAETDSGRVAAGAKARATLAAFPGETFDGTVETLLPDLDPATRTQKARIVMPNPQHRLAPGMFASVEIAPTASPTEQVLVPSEAVIVTGARNVVVVDDGQGRFRAQEVRLGEEAGGKTAVLEGLKDGDSVVLSGQFLIDSEASLSGTLARLDSAAMAPAAESHEQAQHNESASRPLKTTPATPQHLATGKVERIDGHQWTIATDAIPSLDMGAMTMTFVCPAKAPASDIRAGQLVSFSFFRNAEGKFEIAKITGLDESAPKGRKP